jgi:hypothetical protein
MRGLSAQAIREWAFALPATTYQVRGIDAQTGAPTLNEAYSVAELVRSVSFLRHKNANGSHIYARPNSRRHVMIDDIVTATLDSLGRDGLTPALVVETSLNNLQAWITVSKHDLTPSDEGRIARVLARRYGGDPGAAHHTQFGRLPGFRNRKAAYCSPDGGYPLVRIVRRIRSFVAPGAGALLQSLAEESAERPRSIATLPPSPLGGLCSSSPSMSAEEAKDIYNHVAAEIVRRFGADAYRDNRSRLDYAVARSLNFQGFDNAEIQAVLREGSEKGIERGELYIEATVVAATSR